MPLQRLKFEVFGKVQGVSFRAYTCKQANVFGVKGWCRNTDTGTVVGVLEGDEDAVQQMKSYLYQGSPASQVDDIKFGEPEQIDATDTAKFEHESDAAHGAAPADGGDRVERDSVEALVATSATQSGSTDAAQRYLQWAETRSFLVTEAVLAVAFLGLLDGAFSGDWLKYGYIGADVQRALTALGIAGVVGHGAIAVYAAWLAVGSGENVLVAALRGFLAGTPELLRCYYDSQAEAAAAGEEA